MMIERIESTLCSVGCGTYVHYIYGVDLVGCLDQIVWEFRWERGDSIDPIAHRRVDCWQFEPRFDPGSKWSFQTVIVNLE